MKKLVLIFCIAFFATTFLGISQIKTFKSDDKSNNKSDDKMVISGKKKKKSLNDLVVESELIVKGTVEELLNSKWTNPNKKDGIRNTLVKDTKIKINKTFKGKPYNNNYILVRTEGGKTDNLEIISDGYPDFTKGEEIILFLSKDDSDFAISSENYYVLTGMVQGKFKFNKNTLKYENYKENFDIIKLNNLIENPKPQPNKLTKEQIEKQNKNFFGN